MDWKFSGGPPGCVNAPGATVPAFNVGKKDAVEAKEDETAYELVNAYDALKAYELLKVKELDKAYDALNA